jgi:hypothetical protein
LTTTILTRDVEHGADFILPDPVSDLALDHVSVQPPIRALEDELAGGVLRLRVDPEPPAPDEPGVGERVRGVCVDGAAEAHAVALQEPVAVRSQAQLRRVLNV